MYPLARDDVFVSRAGIQACFRDIFVDETVPEVGVSLRVSITAHRFGKIRFQSEASGGLTDPRM